ncbi:WecB/TagA/CpsF family glycosyltransferase [Mycolicibacterium iranicum]|uniref:WecB/TagA/CpsF family glycosyltransferase n=1 Tax=Mycolicibacterium iranicum TaxID=912594 RepID=UPI003AF31D37
MSNGINYADGAPLAALLSLASRRQGGESQQRVRGPSLFEETLRRSEGHAITHLFFGGSKDAIARLEDNVSSRYPFVAAAGYISPPIASANDLAELAARAHADYGGDIVWIGLGQPKQDIVAHLLADQISRPCIGIGAAFDFFAGTVRTAPQWMQASGTEWLYRFAHEPRRLWRRYTIGNMRFLRVASREIGRTRCDRP